MAESNDYSPGVWSGYDFSAARRTYDVHVGRSYQDASSNSVKASSLIPDSIETESEAPVVIACDVTGSMGSWPATIFSKLPYLENEGKEYLGESMEISFFAIGDANSDKYPLQVRPFSKGLDLTKQLEALVIEGNGGGQGCESYDIAAMYVARNVKTPKAIRKPLLIIIGDEGLYSVLDKSYAEQWARTKIDKTLTVEKIFEELTDKFSVYVIRKPYGGDEFNSGTNGPVHNQWVRLLGEERVVMLPGPERVVDVIFGILAKETNRVDYFKKEITDRQRKDQVDVVMKSLRTMHAISAPKSLKKLPHRNVSVTRRNDDDDEGTQSISLL